MEKLDHDGDFADAEKELPNWARRALRASRKPELEVREGANEQTLGKESDRSRSPSPGQERFGTSFPTYRPLKNPQAPSPSLPRSHNIYEPAHIQQSIPSQNFFQTSPKKTAYLRPWSELSLPAYPSLDPVFYKMKAGRVHKQNLQKDHICSCQSDVNGDDDFNASASTGIGNTLESPTYHHNPGCGRDEIKNFGRNFNPGNYPPNVDGHLVFIPNSNYDITSKNLFYPPQVFHGQQLQQNNTRLVSQSRPLMTSQQQFHGKPLLYPTHGFPYQPFQQQSTALNGAASCYIPISLQHAHGNGVTNSAFLQDVATCHANLFSVYRQQENFNRSQVPPNFEPGEGKTSCDITTGMQGPVQSTLKCTADNNNDQTENHNLSNASDTPTSVTFSSKSQETAEHHACDSTTKNIPGSKKENVQDHDIPTTGEDSCDANSLKNESNKTWGTPLFQPREVANKLPPQETQKQENVAEKEDRSPVAYTILFSSKEEAGKPPDLSDKRPSVLSRARSQDRSAVLSKFAETKTPVSNWASRSISAKFKVDKESQSTHDKKPRRSRATGKTTPLETLTPEKPDTFPAALEPKKKSILDDHDHQRTRKLEKCHQYEKSPRTRKPSMEFDTSKESASCDSDCEVASEAGTYVVDGDSAYLKDLRANIPKVFGISEEHSNSKGQSMFRGKTKTGRNKSIGDTKEFDSKTKPNDLSIHKSAQGDKIQSSSIAARRLLPEAPLQMEVPEKISIKGKPPLNDKSGENITKWLSKSVCFPPSRHHLVTNDLSSSDNFKTDFVKCELNNSNRGRQTERQNGTLLTSQKEVFKREATPHKELSGRRSVDPPNINILSRSARTNQSLGLYESEVSALSSQMPKSTTPTVGLAGSGSGFMGRPTRPRSTSRPRINRNNVTRKASDSVNSSTVESANGVEVESSQNFKAKSLVSERLCAPTIATELKSKKSYLARECTPTIPSQPTTNKNASSTSAGDINTSKDSLSNSFGMPQVNGSFTSSSKKRFANSNAPRYGEVHTTVGNEILGELNKDQDEETSSTDTSVPSVVSSSDDGKTASDTEKNLTTQLKIEKYLQRITNDTEALLRDISHEATLSSSTSIDEIISGIREKHVTNEHLLSSLSCLLKLEEHLEAKQAKVATKKYRETTF